MAVKGSRSLAVHDVKQRVAKRQRQQIVDYVEHDKLADLSPDFRFISGAHVQQQRLEHFASIVASKDAFKAAPDGREGNLGNVRMLQCFEGEPEQNTDFLR